MTLTLTLDKIEKPKRAGTQEFLVTFPDGQTDTAITLFSYGEDDKMTMANILVSAAEGWREYIKDCRP